MLPFVGFGDRRHDVRCR